MTTTLLFSSVVLVLTLLSCQPAQSDDLIPNPEKAFSPLDFLGPIQPGKMFVKFG